MHQTEEEEFSDDDYDRTTRREAVLSEFAVVGSKRKFEGENQTTIARLGDSVITPFNMRDEDDEGHWDKHGNFVLNRSEKAHEYEDAWLDEYYEKYGKQPYKPPKVEPKKKKQRKPSDDWTPQEARPEHDKLTKEERDEYNAKVHAAMNDVDSNDDSQLDISEQSESDDPFLAKRRKKVQDDEDLDDDDLDESESEDGEEVDEEGRMTYEQQKAFDRRQERKKKIQKNRELEEKMMNDLADDDGTIRKHKRKQSTPDEKDSDREIDIFGDAKADQEKTRQEMEKLMRTGENVWDALRRYSKDMTVERKNKVKNGPASVAFNTLTELADKLLNDYGIVNAYEQRM